MLRCHSAEAAQPQCACRPARAVTLVRPAARTPSGSVKRVDARPVARRDFLGFVCLGVVTATGCTADESPSPSPTPGPTSSASSDPDPDLLLLSAVRRDEARLIGEYRAVISQHRQLRRDLDPLLDHHRTHLVVLGTNADRSSSPVDHNGAETRRTSGAAISKLQKVEDIASYDRRHDALAAHTGELARFLAAMSASSAQHAVVLDDLGRRLRHADRR